MNVTNSYLQTCRYLVGANLDDPGVWTEIQAQLSGIRLALTCCVCGRLLNQPMGPAPSICHHYVCKDCIGGKMRYIKRGCGWCKSYDDFVTNKQLECVIRCFRQLCQYLQNKAARVLTSLSVDSTISSIRTIIQEALLERDGTKTDVVTSPQRPETLSKDEPVTEGKSDSSRRRKRIRFSDSYNDQDSDKEISFKQSKCDPPSPVTVDTQHFPNGSPLGRSVGRNEGHKGRSRSLDKKHFNEKKPSRRRLLNDSSHNSLNAFDSGDSEKKLENLVLAEHDYNKCTVDEADVNITHSNWNSEDEQQGGKKPLYPKEPTDAALTGKCSKSSSSRELASDTAISMASASGASMGGKTDNSIVNQNTSRKCKNKNKSGCRCALATPNPGKLTCCGQRCPCYAAFRGCNNCKCRGCRNPRGDPRNLPASLLKPVIPSQALSAAQHSSSLNKLSASVT